MLLPGERTAPIRHNSTQVGFCIARRRPGHDRRARASTSSSTTCGTTRRGGRTRTRNDGAEPHVRLDVLQRAAAREAERPPRRGRDPIAAGGRRRARRATTRRVDARRTQPVRHVRPRTTARTLMPYETLIDPPARRRRRALHWPWAEVKAHLDKLEALGDDYVGRRLYLLYNPATGRTNGTTPSFFATMTIRPPAIVDRPHRHVSAAINYFFSGSGCSLVGGQRYEWRAGDLMLTAPGWAIHHHASRRRRPVYELTVQDSRCNLAMESLLWQEDLKRPARLLGAQEGFATNRRATPGDRARRRRPARLVPAAGDAVPRRRGRPRRVRAARRAPGRRRRRTASRERDDGEPSTLTIDERERLSEVAVDVAAGRIAGRRRDRLAEPRRDGRAHRARRGRRRRRGADRHAVLHHAAAARARRVLPRPRRAHATCRCSCTTSPVARPSTSTSGRCSRSPRRRPTSSASSTR